MKIFILFINLYITLNGIVGMLLYHIYFLIDLYSLLHAKKYIVSVLTSSFSDPTFPLFFYVKSQRIIVSNFSKDC